MDPTTAALVEAMREALTAPREVPSGSRGVLAPQRNRAKIGDLDLGVVDDLGVEWTLAGIEGWSSTAKPTLKVDQNPGAHGGTGGQSFYGPRTMTVKGTFLATVDTVDDAVDRCLDAFALDDTVLTVTERGRERWCVVRQQDETDVDVVELPGDLALGTYSAQVVAEDPRKYGAIVTRSTRLPSSSGGLTFPVRSPLVFDGVSNSGRVSLFLAGKMPAPVTLRVDGPVVAPRITHLATGAVLVFASSLALAAGEFLVVDMRQQEALAQGIAPRTQWITSDQWFDAVPGRNDFAFSADAYNSAALLTVSAPSGAWR